MSRIIKKNKTAFILHGSESDFLVVYHFGVWMEITDSLLWIYVHSLPEKESSNTHNSTT